jgi:hypothetical protein
MSITKIENQVKHIISECDNVFSDDPKIHQTLDSIKDAAEQILDDSVEMESELNAKIKELEDEKEDLEEEIHEHESGYNIGFAPNSKYYFESMSGQMALCSSSLADDELLGIFKVLAENVRTSELTNKLKSVLSEYPALCNKLAINI